MKQLSPIILVLYLMIGCGNVRAGGKDFSDVPLPDDEEIVAPAFTVPAEYAAFSGKWFGVWDGILNHVLIVEEIEPPQATVVYAWGVARQWRINKGGWERVRGQFDGDKLKFLRRNGAVTVTYRMRPEGTLRASYEFNTGRISRATMRRTQE